ncbi:HD domain-containing protein [Gimesia fumaroli]|nr:HD domain-containing protein [Gimesia fumaroli]
MNASKLRRQIIFEAARLMYSRQETEYYRAKMKAARKVCQGWVKPADLPSNREIRDEIQRFACTFEGDTRTENLLSMRLQALRFLRMFAPFHPKLIGSTLTGHIRKGSDIDIHVFSHSCEAVTARLDEEGIPYRVEHKTVKKHGEERIFTHIHVQDEYPVELTVYSTEKSSYGFKCSITGKRIERATLPEFEQILQKEYPGIDLDQRLAELEQSLDRFQIFRLLLLPLAGVKQSRKYHPEGDALYHSLQVYDLACDELPYDEEFQLAALLHDVGKAIDAKNHVEAGLQALEGLITERTAWLIRHHMDAHAIRDGTIGARARRRLMANENYEDLLLLEECDHAGREPGVEVPDVDDALEAVRELARLCD